MSAQPENSNTFTLIEIVDLDKIKACLANPLVSRAQAGRLQKYYTLAIKHKGRIPVDYTQKLVGDAYFGRFIPNPPNGELVAAFQKRDLRSSLFSDTDTDIDAVSCHPTILLSLARESNLECKYLHGYM